MNVNYQGGTEMKWKNLECTGKDMKESWKQIESRISEDNLE